ncbi:mitochondrial acyl carrier protein [Malassezia cuniculi]|uniref:Acyl carrier protein n=1 Tax=Malassezia cuniculi TaxID=948313 RepID=A0AAF0EMZ3_9BASI|nr:mitochondrial acyl carrier protein [Malassezia cuniculi]
MLPIALRTLPRAMRAAPAAARTMPMLRVAMPPAFARGYAAAGALSGDEIRTRIEEVLRSFEKVDPTKVTPAASFTGDLGLDSLDAVEVVMAIEEEFNIVRVSMADQEIPDAEADAIASVQDAIDYISRTPDGT